jgi:hypothetical protein
VFRAGRDRFLVHGPYFTSLRSRSSGSVRSERK